MVYKLNEGCFSFAPDHVLMLKLLTVQNDLAVGDLAAERAQHVQPGQRGRERDVQALARLQGSGQGV